MGKKILLTGGAGFIGSHTYVACSEAGYDVTILDNFENSRRDVADRLSEITNFPTKVVDCDIRDLYGLRQAFAAESYDAVIHFAARKSISDGEANPVGYYQSNCGGLINVVSAMREHSVNAIVFSSSAAVYGNPIVVPTDETADLMPENVYARTKQFGEELLTAVSRSDPKFISGILRYFNPVGAHASGLIGEDPDQPPNNLVPVIARLATGQIDELSVFGGDYPTPDGTCIRDYIHITDLARGHVLSLNALLSEGTSHLVNLGTGKGHSVLEVLATYANISKRNLAHKVVNRRAGDAAVSCADTTLARKILGFETEFDLQSMCESNWAFAKTKN